MNLLPPLPAWDAMHPLVVHFPIALVCIAPLFLLFALVWPGRWKEFMTVAALVAVMGAAACVVAVMTGEATEKAVIVGSADRLMHEHEELAETARTIALVVAAAAVLMAGFAWLRPKTGLVGRALVTLVLLGGQIAAISFVARAAHAGGRLVHEHGVTAPMGGPKPLLDAD